MFEKSERQEREKRWAKALRQGDHTIIGLLYDSYAPVLLGLISRIIRDKEKAEAVLLDTFLTIWKQRAFCDPSKTGLLTWMILLAKETALETVRSVRFKSFPDGQEISTFGRSENENPGLEGTGSENNFCNLTADEKAALDMIYLKGYSCAEAAKTLNISEETLVNSLKMAIKQLGTQTAL